MRKYFLSLVALTATLFTTSCQESIVEPQVAGPTTFTVQLPAQMGTKAIGEHDLVNKLYVQVYPEDVNGDMITSSIADVNGEGKATVQLNLIQDQVYNIVFWAQNDNAYNTGDLRSIPMNVNHHNNESGAAFYAFVENFTPSADPVTVKLARPFAQLNIRTTEESLTNQIGTFELETSKVTVTGIAKKFNTIEGYGEEAEDVVFTDADVPSEDIVVNGVKYKYVSMDYLPIVGDTKAVAKVSIDITLDNNQTVSHTWENIPLQKNYRTNIFGNLISSSTDFNVTIDDSWKEESYDFYLISNSNELKSLLTNAINGGETDIVIDAYGNNIGDLNYGLTKALIPTGVKVTIKNATIQGRSYGNGVDGEIVFENCIFTHTGAYSIHFDNGAGKVIFKNCVLYGWNSFGSTLESVSFYDSKLYGNGTYALIRSYVDLHVENCYFNTIDADHTDVYNEGVEVVNGATLTEINCSYSSQVNQLVEEIEQGGDVTITEDIAVSANSNIHTQNITDDVTINGNGSTVESHAESADDFQWEGGTIPAMSTIFSSADGSKVVVNDLNFTGTMSALMLGHYQNSTYNNYNTELNNVNVIGTEVVSFSAGISPAMCIYGTATLNNCQIYGTTLSPLDTDPMWPVYDVASVNYSTTYVNGGKIGTFYIWNQGALILDQGAEVGTITIAGNMNTTKPQWSITIKAGTSVGAIDLSKITNKNRVNLNIEAGATIGKFISNGNEYATLDEWKNA